MMFHPVPSIWKPTTYSGIESILNGGFDAADFVGNRRTNVVPDAGHRRRNALHHVGNGTLDAVPDRRTLLTNKSHNNYTTAKICTI